MNTFHNKGATIILGKNFLLAAHSRVKREIIPQGNRKRLLLNTSGTKNIDYDYEHEHEKTLISSRKVCL